MVTIISLWPAILLSAVLVWIASALIWTVLPHHKKDFRALPDEEAVRRALGRPEPGQYNLPHCESMAQLKDEAMRRKFQEGPIGFLTIVRSGVPSMGRPMILSFLFYLVVGIIIAYVTGRTLPAGAEYLHVFQIAGTVAWLAYGFGTVPDGIWFGRPWPAVVKHLIDALVYALLTAGAFGWLWPGPG